MNPNRDLERRLADFYASKGVLRAPDRILSTTLATVDTTPQRRRIPWQLSRGGGRGAYARFAVASFLVVAGTAIVMGILSAAPGDVGRHPIQESPSTPPTPRPNEEGSGNFLVPFTYVLPEGAEFDYGTRDPIYFEIRIPAAHEAGHAAGVIVEAIGGGRVDPCDPESPYVPLSPGPQSVIDYLKTIPDMTVTDESVASVGELPAFQARVTAGTETPTCQDLWPWSAARVAFTEIPRELVVRMVAVDVGEHVVFTVFGEDTNPGWPEMAEELIDSFRFGTPDTEELDKFRFETPLPERSPAPS